MYVPIYLFYLLKIKFTVSRPKIVQLTPGNFFNSRVVATSSAQPFVTPYPYLFIKTTRPPL